MRKILLGTACALTIAIGGTFTTATPAQANGASDIASFCKFLSSVTGESVGDCVSESVSHRPFAVSLCKEWKEECPEGFAYVFGNLGRCIQDVQS